MLPCYQTILKGVADLKKSGGVYDENKRPASRHANKVGEKSNRRPKVLTSMHSAVFFGGGAKQESALVAYETAHRTECE